ncbi:aspartate/glutamate racemase family protein [Loktanella agnita]|uniref:aspartate/glutamate racemase family protein n=1 Tax=Loktanella agnita TaxID=287097 RepID=UPI003987BB12
MHLAFLHTGDVHVARFDAVLDTLAPQTTRRHHVAPELLERARRNGIDASRAETIAILQGLASADAVICSCSTLGPLTDEAAAHHPHIIRIDRPMMDAACAHGARVLVALCLESTREATMAVLDECAARQGITISPQVVIASNAWTAFEAGNMADYADEIAAAIRQSIAQQPADCIVLAQASMDVAAEKLTDLGVPVLTSPRAAVQHALAIAAE